MQSNNGIEVRRESLKETAKEDSERLSRKVAESGVIEAKKDHFKE
jgi:hypothetical protein